MLSQAEISGARVLVRSVSGTKDTAKPGGTRPYGAVHQGGLVNESVLNEMLTGFLRNSPAALVFYDRSGSPLFQTALGTALLGRWNRALRDNGADEGLPVALHRAFDGSEESVCINHPMIPGLAATLEATHGGFVLSLVDERAAGVFQEMSTQALVALKKLSRSEQRVAKLAKDGLRNEDIAARLCRSTRTVEFQLNSAFRKLGVKNRIQLARILS